MIISELIEKLEKAKEKYGDLKIYLSVDYEEKCPKCGQPESHIKDGFANFATVVNQGELFMINAEEDV